MLNILTVLLQILPIVLLILLGMVLRKIAFLDSKTVDALKKIVLNISLPAMMFLAFARTQFNLGYLAIIASVFSACLLMLALFNGLAKRIYPDNPFVPALFAGFETGMIGYALYAAVFGQESIWRLAIFDLGQVFFVFFVLVAFLNQRNGQKTSGKDLVFSFLTSPVILSILVGLIFSLTGLTPLISGLPAGNNWFEVFTYLSQLTVPLITVAIGFELHLSRDTLRGPLLAALVRLAFMMGLATLINQVVIISFLKLDSAFSTALYTLFLLPPPFIIPIFMQEKRPENRQFILNTLSVHVVLTLIAFTIIMM